MPPLKAFKKLRADYLDKARESREENLVAQAAAVEEDERRREKVEESEYFRHEENLEAIDGGLRSFERYSKPT